MAVTVAAMRAAERIVVGLDVVQTTSIDEAHYVTFADRYACRGVDQAGADFDSKCGRTDGCRETVNGDNDQ